MISKKVSLNVTDIEVFPRELPCIIDNNLYYITSHQFSNDYDEHKEWLWNDCPSEVGQALRKLNDPLHKPEIYNDFHISWEMHDYSVMYCLDNDCKSYSMEELMNSKQTIVRISLYNDL